MVSKSSENNQVDTSKREIIIQVHKDLYTVAFVTVLFLMSISNSVHVISQGVAHPIREPTVVSKKIFNFVIEGQ